MEGTIEELIAGHEYEEAAVKAQSLIQLQPQVAKWHAYHGLAKFRLEKFEEAVPALKTAVTLDPHFEDALVKLAQCFDRLNLSHECALVVHGALHQFPANHALQGLWQAHGHNFYADKENWERGANPFRHQIFMGGDPR
jgi:tetratricopeptide (TPR) repeat protein